MRFVKFSDHVNEVDVFINAEHVVCVREGSEDGTSAITTTANANGLHTIYVVGEPEDVAIELARSR